MKSPFFLVKSQKFQPSLEKLSRGNLGHLTAQAPDAAVRKLEIYTIQSYFIEDLHMKKSALLVITDH
jgi:hypothetical protein